MTAVTGITPWAISQWTDADGVIQGVSASEARGALGALLGQSGPMHTYSGVIPQGTDPATGTPAGLVVSPSTPASMQLTVAPGYFAAQSDTAGTPYIGGLDRPATVQVPPANDTFDRTDAVVIWVEDSDAGFGTERATLLDVFSGPADGSLAAPTTLPEAHVVLSQFTTAAASPSVPNTPSVRPFEVAAGGVRPVFGGIGVNDPGYPGQMRAVVDDDGAIDLSLFGLDTDWHSILTKRNPWTPVLTSEEKTCDLGASGSATGVYQIMNGGLCYLYAKVLFSGSGVSVGGGRLSFVLPDGLQALPDQRIPCTVQGTPYPWSGLAYLSGPGCYPTFPSKYSDVRLDYLQAARVGGGKGTGIPHIDGNWTVVSGTLLIVSGSFLIEP